MVAVTVPRYGPERVCWALSDAYHANEGGHIRIYTDQGVIGQGEATDAARLDLAGQRGVLA